MIIYVDLLVTVNFVIDFLLLSTSAIILRTEISTIRQVLASIFGGILSLYIFVESSLFLLNIFFRTLSSALIILICVGIKNKNTYLKFYFSYLASSFLLAGAMFFVSQGIKSNFITTNNTYIYLNISPLFLILTTLIIYLSVKLFFKFKKQPTFFEKCEATIFLNSKNETFKVLIDTGNSVKDILGNSEIIFISPKAFINFTNKSTENIENDFKNRFRLIPINTINGSSLKKGVRIDKAIIVCDKRCYEMKNPVLVISDREFNDEFDIIISPEILLKQPVKIFKGGEKLETSKYVY